MATTLKETEAIPASYPAAPTGLSTEAAALDPAMVWARIEAYTNTRYTSRAVVWTVEGPGEWVPPLTPATIAGIEVWAGEEWSEVFPAASPLDGYDLAADGPYRVTGTVGGGEVPAAVSEAFRRLAEYSAEISETGMLEGHPSHTSHGVKIGSSIDETYSRSATWAARALQLSGAADLLRPYRRLA